MNKIKTILMTVGACYITTRAILVLLQDGFVVLVVNNLSNASAESLKRVAQLAGHAPRFVDGDIRDRALFGCSAKRYLATVMRDIWPWQCQNPDGYHG